MRGALVRRLSQLGDLAAAARQPATASTLPASKVGHS
jgi:hypothetical protein